MAKLKKGYYSEDSHLLIVLYSEDRHSLAPKWNRDIQEHIDDFPGHVNVITMEDLSNFLDISGTGADLNNPLPSKLRNLMDLKKNTLAGDDDAFNVLIDIKDRAIISLSEMKVNNYWYDHFLSSR